MPSHKYAFSQTPRCVVLAMKGTLGLDVGKEWLLLIRHKGSTNIHSNI